MLSETFANPNRLAARRTVETASKGLALTLMLASASFAQVLISPVNPTPADAVMGFETAAGWSVKSTSPATAVTASTIRTQGAHAFGLANVSGTVTLTSAAVASTEPALSAVSEADSIFAMDVMPPASGGSGSLALYVSSPSRGVKGEVAEVQLSALKPFLYTTLKFPIPAAVRTALAGASFKDLTFVLELSGTTASTAGNNYLFDNLRAVDISPVTAKIGLTLPAHFGGALSLAAQGNTAASQAFDIGTVQVPGSFRLAAGNAAGTTVQLKLGYDGTAAYTCTYNPDPSDKTGLSYAMAACTGGVQAGDLVGANYAAVTIVGGSADMKLQADLARNPVGDQVGRSLIPPMPTYWGKADTCVPAPVTGTVYTISPSCTAQINEASQIATAYFNTLTSSQAPYNFVAAPVADRAINHGTAQATPVPPADPTQSQDIPINQNGHANKGGDFDAYWTLTGDFNTKATAATGNSSAHFDAEFGGHVVLFGGDVDVVDVKASVDTATGSSPKATGNVSFFLFGEQVPGGGSVNASTGLNTNLSASQQFNAPDIDFWIFSLKVGATATASLTTSGTLAATGFNVTVDPKVTMGVSISGGVNVVFASGGVDAKVNLLQVELPIKSQAGLIVNADPDACSITVDLTLDANVTVSALGGEIDLQASFGPCPFCYPVSEPLFKWGALLSTTQNLINIGPDTLAAVELPTTLCTPNIKATVNVPGSSAQVGITYPLQATAATVGGTPITCGDFTWSVSPAETITGTGCNASILFSKVGSHTLTLSIAASFKDSFGRSISGTGSATESVALSTLAPGVYIIGVNPAPVNVQAPFNNQTIQLGNGAAPQFTGEYVGSAASVNETWTMTNGGGKNFALVSKPLANNVSQATWAGPALPVAGTYTVTMTTTDSSGKVLGSSAMMVNIVSLNINAQ